MKSALPSETAQPSPLAFAWMFAAIVAGSLVVSCFLAVWVFQSLDGSGGVVENLLLSRGPHKLMRRIAMIFLVVMLPWTLRKTCWRGWNDLGWGGGFDRRRFLKGVGIGLLTLGAVAGLTALLEYRVLDPKLRHPAIELKVLRYLLSALVVGVFEETLTRGILFRSLSRLWGAVTTALVTSLFFALAHFMSPQADAFTQGPVLQVMGQVLMSMADPLTAGSTIWLEVVNLTLMSLVLCAAVVHTGTVWLAAGLHAGWVYVKLFNSAVMDTNRDLAPSLWLGHASDNLDSLAVSVLLTVMLAWFLRACGNSTRFMNSFRSIPTVSGDPSRTKPVP